jgi:hypothetical protein
MDKKDGTWLFNCPHAKNGTLYYNSAIINCPKCNCYHYSQKCVMPSTEMVMEWTKNFPVKKLMEVIQRF